MKRVICVPPLLLCFACGNDGIGTSLETGIVSTADSGGDGDTSTGGETGEPFEAVPARGLTITGVTANHGINVSFANGDQWVDGFGREGRLATGRDTLIRVYYTLDPNWVEHEVQLRGELHVGGEVINLASNPKIITVDSSDQYLDGTLWLALIADQGHTAVDAKIQVSLWDVGPGGEGLEEHITVSPASGPELIGFEDIPMEMNVVWVPFSYNGKVPATDDEANMTILDNELYQAQPIRTLNTEIAPLHSNGASYDMCEMLLTMSQIWSQAGAPDNVYYSGLVNTGAASGVIGCANLGSRYSAVVWIENSLGVTATSAVHEIGHDQGLRHVQCDDMGNPAADPDPSYPDAPLGRTLNTGFGIRDYQMYPGDTTIDYMSYCNKRWVSPWTWNKVWTRIQALTAEGSPDIVDPTPVMHFAIWGSGKTSWWTALDRLDPERPPDSGRVEFVLGGEVIAREPAFIDILSDDKSMWVTVPMPNGEDEAEFDSVRYIAQDDTVYEARRDEVSFYTQVDFINPPSVQ
jgi:hypothetical protein